MLSENGEALGPVLDDVIGELAALRADLADPAALRARLEAAAAGDDVVRRAEPPFEPCSSLPEAVERAGRDGAAVAVRRRAGVLEVAEISTVS